MVSGYCMKCKKRQDMVNTENVVTKNGNNAVKGQCKKCGTNMFVILPKSKVNAPSKSTKSKKSKSKTKSKSTKSKKSKSKAKSKSKK
jgi:hypothetical protein